MEPNLDAVIFDLGNVLLTLRWERMFEHFRHQTGKTREELAEYVLRATASSQLACGSMSQVDYYETIARELGFRGPYVEFARMFSDMFDQNEPMLQLAADLKARVPRIVLSNTNAIHMREIFARFPVIHDFDGHVLSHEVGYEKPDPRIYLYALRRYRLRPERTVFIDDILPNVSGARAVGIHGIHYQTAAQTLEELRPFLPGK